MGNEGSLPQGVEDVDEELEYQAKAPPSAITPPGLGPSSHVVATVSGGGGGAAAAAVSGGGLSNGMSNSGTTTTKTMTAGASTIGGGVVGSVPPMHPMLHHPQQQQQQRSGRHLMGSVFSRRGNAHNQNSTGIERTETAAATTTTAYMHSNIVPMPGEELTYMNSPDASYYGAGGGYPPPPPPQQPMYIQQQQQQNQQQQHALPNQQYYNTQQQQQAPPPPPQDPQSKEEVVGIMYERSSNSNNNTPSGSARKSRRTGAGLIHSMRNLSLGFGGGNNNNSGNANAVSASSPSRGFLSSSANSRQQVNDWETKWDEDEDEEDDEEEEVESYGGGKLKPPRIPHHPYPTTPMRPAMDSGYAADASAAAGLSSSSPLRSQYAHGTNTTASAAPFVSPGLAGGDAPRSQPPYMPTSNTTTTTTPTGTPAKAHLVTATPETPGLTTTLTASRRTDDDDGMEWDTGMQTAITGADGLAIEKPNVEQFLPLLRVLGKGSFGKVVLVQKRVGREQGSLFAMKILRKSHLVRRRQIERTRTERKVLSVVNHPFIMKLHYAFQSPDKLYLVLDYCPGGELFFHLSRFRRFPERVARFYSAELLLALGHLHKRGIIYRDLKPENVLLDADGHVKLGDFGLAKAGIRHAYEGATSMCGTPEYMAPEVLAQQGHGFCVDYWGLGMLTYEMMTGLPPWYTTDRAKLFRRLRSAPLDIPPYFSAASASFTSALLERNPRRRLGVTGIRAAMEHEFFKSISWRALYGRRVEAPIRPCEGWTPPEASEQKPYQQQTQTVQHHPTSSSNGTGSNFNPNDLDAATANFDNQFTRMPVETDDNGEADDDDLDELHEDTFVGFTFDDNDRDELEAAQQQQQQEQRPRTHHYPEEGTINNNQVQHHLD